MPSLAPSIATESTLIARAGVYRSARLWARWNRAALPPRVLPLKLGCPARKRVVWASGRKRLRVGCPRPLLALRSLWGGLGTRPRAFPVWEAASVALCGARGGDLRAADSSAPTPPGLQVPEVRLGGVGVLKSVKFLRNCVLSTQNRLKRRSCQSSMCFFCGLPTLLIVGSVYPPLNTDHWHQQY
jgi:hypothetical protein